VPFVLSSNHLNNANRSYKTQHLIAFSKRHQPTCFSTPDGTRYMIYADRISGWTCVTTFARAPSSKSIISALRSYFVDLGVPVRIRTDGGPQIAAHDTRQFLKGWGVKHEMSSPYWPQSNGHAESAVKVIKSLIRKPRRRQSG
jgi:transposase InsO family protein